MTDLLIELNNVTKEIENQAETLYLIVKYYEDIISLGYINQIELQNIDFCLDYLDYCDFSKLASSNLKKLQSEVRKEIAKIQSDIEQLNIRKEEIIDQIISYSSFNRDELTEILYLFGNKENIPKVLDSVYKENTLISFFIKLKNRIFLNKGLKNIITPELLDFIKFYINLKSWGESKSIEEAYLLYDLETKDDFRTCLNR